MRCLLVFILYIVNSFSFAADLCTAGENVLFSCKLENTKKLVSLCQSQSEQKRVFYKFGKLDQIDITLPSDRSPQPKISYERFGPAITQGVEHIIFKNGDFLYVVSTLQGISNSLNVYKGNRLIAKMGCQYQTETGLRVAEVVELLSSQSFKEDKKFCSFC